MVDSEKDNYTGVIDAEESERPEEANLQELAPFLAMSHHANKERKCWEFYNQDRHPSQASEDFEYSLMNKEIKAKLKLKKEEELDVFRAQWMSELNPIGSSIGSDMEPGEVSSKKPFFKSSGIKGKQELAREEKAKELFLKAVEQEQNGAVYEAIKYYRRAMQLVPDIEFRITYVHSPESDGNGKAYKEDMGKTKEITDLLPYFQQQLTLQDSLHKICQPEFGVNQTHISALVEQGQEEEQQRPPLTPEDPEVSPASHHLCQAGTSADTCTPVGVRTSASVPGHSGEGTSQSLEELAETVCPWRQQSEDCRGPGTCSVGA